MRRGEEILQRNHGTPPTTRRGEVYVTLFTKVLWGPEHSGSLVTHEPKRKKMKRTILTETVVASSHGTLTINKVYFLTCT